jgi:hypothetical protein
MARLLQRRAGGDDVTYVEDLNHELAAVGITGRLRRRISAEIEDHLACDPQAELGAPRVVARRFADELGTSRALRAAAVSFAALALAGILFALAFLTSPYGFFGSGPRGGPALGRLATALALVAPQVAFVAGILAALRALNRRRTAVMPAAEAAVLVRRAAVGAASGVATMVGLGLLAVEYHRYAPGSWQTFAEVSAGVGIVALGACAPALVSAVRLGPVAPGPAGDIFTDLGRWTPTLLRGRPWRLALIVAAAIVVSVTVTGIAASDPFDGAARGIADGLACLVGFATLGRYLGLWVPAPTPPAA